jgi:hypothetical protein
MKTKVLTTIAGALLLLGVGMILFAQYRGLLRLRDSNSQLRLSMERLTREGAAVTNSAAISNAEPAEEIGKQHEEMALLRAQTEELRKQTQAWEQVRLENRAMKMRLKPDFKRRPKKTMASQPIVQPELRSESVAFAGYGDPESSLQSNLWAMNHGDLKTYMAGQSAERQYLLNEMAKSKGQTQEEIAQRLAARKSNLHILKREVAAEDEVWLTFQSDLPDAPPQTFIFKRCETEWKMAGYGTPSKEFSKPAPFSRPGSPAREN